jgi:hypothetical protein
MPALAAGSRLVSDFGRQACGLPCSPAAYQRTGLGPMRHPKLSRHPGACGFVLSGTVEHHRRMVVEPKLPGLADCIIR